MDVESHRELKVLEAISENERTSQRSLAAQLGIALGLTNLYLKRLVRKGYIKCVTIPSNRVLYLITPKGIAEKTRLTYEYMEYSLLLYKQVRTHLRSVLQDVVASGHKRVAIYGTGEAAELAYLSIKEAGLELTAVFNGSGDQPTFLGMPVRDVRDQSGVYYDVIVIAVLDNSSDVLSQIRAAGVPDEKVRTLRA